VNLYSLLVYIEHNGNESPKDFYMYCLIKVKFVTRNIDIMLISVCELCKIKHRKDCIF